MSAKPFSLTVKAVVTDARQRCLLLRRSAANHSFAGQWEWPGGKVDAGEDFAHAVVRETREETALAVEITGLAGATQYEMPVVQVVLLCMEVRVIGGEIQLSEEHDDFAWVPWAELNQYPLVTGIGNFMLAHASKKGTHHG